MGLLNEQQCNRAIEVMNEYLSAPPGQDSKTPLQSSVELDEKRINIIENKLKPLLSGFLNSDIPLLDFKSKIDSINSRNPLWGFGGTSGQMFFNMVCNVANDLDELNECNQEIKLAITIPDNIQIASSRIKNFIRYIKRLREQWTDAGKTLFGAPKVGSIPFFLSYFWQIQDHEKWPAYYPNSVKTITDLNLWQPSGDLSQDYLTFKNIHEELAVLYTEKNGKQFSLYGVEHIFWYKATNSLINSEETIKPTSTVLATTESQVLLPNSYVPPIVAILPRMATNEKGLDEVAKNSGISLERAFEKNIDVAFKILGFETDLLGQGKGRVPDGIASANDESYVIMWDAKIRTDEYGMGTEDRAIREYIDTQYRDLKKRRSQKNIYFLIISSNFVNDHDDTISYIKMVTNVNEVILLEADALVTMVDIKIRDPLNFSLGPEGLQRLFTKSGIITADMVRERLQ